MHKQSTECLFLSTILPLYFHLQFCMSIQIILLVQLRQNINSELLKREFITQDSITAPFTLQWQEAYLKQTLVRPIIIYSTDAQLGFPSTCTSVQ